MVHGVEFSLINIDTGFAVNLYREERDHRLYIRGPGLDWQMRLLFEMHPHFSQKKTPQTVVVAHPGKPLWRAYVAKLAYELDEIGDRVWISLELERVCDHC